MQNGLTIVRAVASAMPTTRDRSCAVRAGLGNIRHVNSRRLGGDSSAYGDGGIGLGMNDAGREGGVHIQRCRGRGDDGGQLHVCYALRATIARHVLLHVRAGLAARQGRGGFTAAAMVEAAGHLRVLADRFRA